MTTVISHAIDGTGYYKGVYPFINDKDGDNPYNWGLYEDGGTVNVISDIGGHNKIVEIAGDATANPCGFTNAFSQTSGTVECWIRKHLTTNLTDVVISNTLGVDQLRLYFGVDGHIWYDNGVGTNDTGIVYAADTWYHITIIFDTSTTWSFYIAGLVSQAGISYTGTPVTMIIFGVGGFLVGKGVGPDYVDAVGYDWFGNYTVGDNLTEYPTVVYKRALAKRGVHCSYKGFSTFDINKMVFPEVI